jgi:ABC-2 type transport system permease protein
MWARNLGNLFVSPLTPLEHVLSMMTMSLIRTLVGLTPAVLLAIPLYHYSIFTLGLPLIAFFANLMIFSWSIGLLVTSLILRYGLGAENLAWVVVFALAPVSAVYYPITVLPQWLQAFGWALPSTYVFEGMRGVLFLGAFDGALLAGALALNAVYIALGMAAYLYAFRRARERGALLQVGE